MRNEKLIFLIAKSSPTLGFRGLGRFGKIGFSDIFWPFVAPVSAKIGHQNVFENDIVARKNGRASRVLIKQWIPAVAGMTSKEKQPMEVIQTTA